MHHKESHAAQQIRESIEIAMGLESQSLLDCEYPSSEKIDNACVDRVCSEMKNKLHRKRLEGKDRWWDISVCSDDFLMSSLRHHIEKGDMIDVMNLAMMIQCRK